MGTPEPPCPALPPLTQLSPRGLARAALCSALGASEEEVGWGYCPREPQEAPATALPSPSTTPPKHPRPQTCADRLT